MTNEPAVYIGCDLAVINIIFLFFKLVFLLIVIIYMRLPNGVLHIVERVRFGFYVFIMSSFIPSFV
jgi:hypothetical protein